MRTNVANVLATNATQWIDLFSLFNSGTYNDQWMVFDNNRFVPGKPLLPETFMVAEQLPGLIVVGDQTEHLQKEGYWGSYNIPFYKEVYEKSGFPNQDPSWFYSYTKCPRAKIMKRLQSNITSVDKLKRFIRFNDWQRDPDSRGQPCEAISARCDQSWIYGLDYSLEGGIDAKVCTATMAKTLSFFAQNGPSYDQQPVFDWRTAGPFPNDAYEKEPVHVGMPDRWEFPWIFYRP